MLLLKDHVPSGCGAANTTSSINCTETACAYDVKVCNKVSDSCIEWWSCLNNNCKDSTTNGAFWYYGAVTPV